MEILSFIAALWAQFAPTFEVIKPFLLLLAPIASAISPFADLATGPISFVWYWVILPPFKLWILYLAVMHLKEVRDAGNLTGPIRYPAYAVLAIGYAFDAFVTIVLGTLAFWDFPKEMTLTARLTRYVAGPAGRRKRMAIALSIFTERFDPRGWHVIRPIEPEVLLP